jgi:cadmium resistance protein CadD (predicted permease)
MEIDFLSSVAIGGAVFASTDVDDLLMLLALFADPALDRHLIVIGQFIGMAILVLASVLIALATVPVSRENAAILGVVPLTFGLWRLWKLWHSQHRRRNTKSPDSFDLGAGPRTASQLLAVSVLTVSNGADNLVAYVPLFAAAPERIPLYTAVFAALTAAWCALAYLCVNNRVVRAQAHRFGHTVFPFAMVLLGLWTLSGISGHIR